MIIYIIYIQTTILISVSAAGRIETLEDLKLSHYVHNIVIVSSIPGLGSIDLDSVEIGQAVTEQC